VRAPISKTYPAISKTLFVTPATSPVYMNNPGYSIMELTAEDGITKVDWRFYQLYQYLLFRIKNFITIDPESLYNVKFNNGSTVYAFNEKMASNS
jgi:hypothetical protein